METILVTGADGLLGKNTIDILLERGFKVRALLERNKVFHNWNDKRIETVYGDILNYNDVLPSVKNCSYIIHMAANTNLWPSRSYKIRDVNIKGTKNIIKAALKYKMKRMIFVGTANSFGYGTKDKPGHEKKKFNAKRYKLDYIDSKFSAFQIVKDAIRKNGLPCITVSPTFMLGPHDSKPSSGKVIMLLYNKKMPGYTSGGRNFVYVKDVAVGIVNALKIGKVGEAYIMGNINMSYKEAFGLIAKTIDVKAPKIHFYNWMTLLFGIFCEMKSIFTKKPPAVSYRMAKISCHEHYYSSEKAVNELKMPQTDIKEAIKESFFWLKENGYLKRSG